MRVPGKITEAIFEHGMREAPLEACGYLAGNDGGVVRAYPMRNADQSADHFTLEPEEQFRVIREARAENLKVLAVYHTHPASPARPSAEDIRLAADPNMVYVIASLLDGGRDIKGFRIVKGEAGIVDLEVI